MIIFLVDLPLPYASGAEAYTHHERGCLAQQIGCNRFIIQSDNTQVIETMQDCGFFFLYRKKDGGFSSTLSAICYDYSIVASGFTMMEYMCCPRDANSATYKIA
jgi:hypothetical protein